MKILFIVLDGLGDRPCNSLKNKTPLDAAKKPCMDFLARNGMIGSMTIISKNIAPESDQGMLSLLGYDIFKTYTGRGPLEAYGNSIKIKKGQVIIRCNFATLCNSKIHHNRINDIESMPSRDEVKKIECIKIPHMKFKKTIGYRGVLIISKNLSPRVSNSHPGYKVVKNFVTTALPVRNRLLMQKNVIPFEKKAGATAEMINNFIEKAGSLLKNKTILTRGAGNKLPVSRNMKSWTILADMPVEIAIGKLSKMKVVKKPKNLKALSDIVKKEIKNNNVYVQIKTIDALSHRNKPVEKMKAIEDIDKNFISNIKDIKNTAIVITADHSTPCNLMSHSSDPVPFLIYGLKKGTAKTFSERKARETGLKIHATSLLKMLWQNTKYFK